MTNGTKEYTYKQNDTIYLAGMGIDIVDMNGNIINQWDLSNDGIEEAIDLYVKNDIIYTTGFEDNVMLIYRLPSNQADILSYSVPLATETDFIEVEGVTTRIEIAVPQGTNISNLTPTFTLSEGAKAYNIQTADKIFTRKILKR